MAKGKSKTNALSVMTSSDAEWRAQSDAETLARAAEIKADKARMAKASAAAKKMVDEAAARAKAMKQIAKSGPKKKGKK